MDQRSDVSSVATKPFVAHMCATCRKPCGIDFSFEHKSQRYNFCCETHQQQKLLELGCKPNVLFAQTTTSRAPVLDFGELYKEALLAAKNKKT